MDEKGVVHILSKSDMEDRMCQDVSLMPSDLQKLMTTEELIDLVEYLSTLQERQL
jgi:hypothetical protein